MEMQNTKKRRAPDEQMDVVDPAIAGPSTSYHSQARATTSHQSQAGPSTSYKSQAGSSSSHQSQAGPSSSYESQAVASTSHQSPSGPSTLCKSQAEPSTSYKSQAGPSTSHQSQAGPSTSYQSQAVASTSHQSSSGSSTLCKSQAEPSTSYKSQAGPSSSHQSQAGPSTSYQSQAVASTSHQSSSGSSTSYQSQAGPSTSYKSQAGPSTPHQSQVRPSTSYQSQARPSTSYKSQAGPSTSYKSQAGSSSSHQSQAGPSSSYESQAVASTSHQSASGPSTSYQSQAGPSTSYQSQAGPSTSYKTQPGPSTSHQSQAGPSTSYQSQAVASTSYKSQAGPSTSYKSQPGPSTSHQSQAGPSTSYQSQAGASTSYQSQAGPSTSYKSQAGPSTSLQSLAGPSTSYQSQAVASTSHQSSSGSSTSYQSQAGPSTSYKSQAGPSTPHQSQVRPSTSYQSQAGPSTSYKSQAGPSTSYKSQAGPSTSHQSQARPSTSYQSEAVASNSHQSASGPSTSYQSQAGPSTSYQSQAGPSTSYKSQPGPSTSHQSQAGPSTSYQSQAGPSTSYQSQAGPSASYKSQAGPSTSLQSQAGPSTSYKSQAGPSTSLQSQAGPSTSYQSQAGPSTSYKSQAGPSTSYQSQDGPSTSYQSQAGPSTSYQSQAGPSTSYQSQAGASTSYQSQAGPSTSYQSQDGPSTSYQSQAGPSTSYQSQAGPSTSYQSQAGASTSYQSQAGPSTSYQSQAGPSTSYQSQAGASTSHQSQENLLVNDDSGDGDDHMSVDEDDGIRIGADDIYIPPAAQPALSYDSTGPRLIISHIVNENFKSYAGVQCLGPFHKNYSSIIGRNGTGKSNVIDSMLFVFGFRASKIRSKKLSVLIHSSSKHPNITSTTVSVHFCKIIDGEGDDFTVVPGSEIVVSKTALRDSSSFYCLNGNRVLFKEVAKVLRSLGIDLDHSRFLILQNEVEQIAMMPPKGKNDNDTGMLEYLEDIIGTNRFKDPIQKVALKVEEYTEICKHQRNRLRVAEQAMIQLEEPMKDAIDLIHLTNTALRTRNMLLQKYLHESSKIIENKQTDLEDFNVNLAAVDDKLKKIQEELERKRNVLKEGTKKYCDLRKKKEEITEKLQGCKRKAVTTQAELTQGNKKKSNLDQLIEQERGKLIDLELIPEKNQREIVDCEALLARRTEKKQRAEEELQRVVASVITETRALQEVKDRLQAKQISLKKRVDEANNMRKLRESELKLYLSTERKEVNKLEKIKEDLKTVQATLEEKRPLQEELSRTVPANEAKLSEVNNKLQRLKETEEKIKAELRPLRLLVEVAREAIREKETRDLVLRAIMQELREGRILGIYGRLGDLGGIDSKYDIAISSCCRRLDDILVDTLGTATECVHFLKSYEIGRGNFLLQDKLEHWRPHYQERKSFPENVPRLFDQVTVKDPRVLPVFYFALRDTLVATDLEQATRIGYGIIRYRVVTLAGEIVELSGTMSGGGRPLRGKMCTTVQLDTTIDRAVIKANELKIGKLEESLAATRLEQSELEETLGVLLRTLRNDKIELHRLNNELKTLSEQLPIVQNHLTRQEEIVVANRVDPEQKAAFEASIETAQQEVDLAKDAVRIVKDEVETLDSQISAIAGNRVTDLQKNVSQHVKKIDKVISEITKLKVAINTSKRNARKSKDKIQQIQADLTETEGNLETLNNQKRQFSLEIEKLQKDLEDVDEQNDGAGDFKELKQEIQNLQTKENKTKAERLERNNVVMKMEKSIQECMDKRRMWERELRSLKLEEPDIEGIPGLEPILPLAQHTAEELEEAEVEELRTRLAAQRNSIGDKRPNIQVIQDYKAKQDSYLQKTAELHRITTRRNDMRSLHDKLNKQRITEFKCGFNTIAAKLQETYQLITLGGYAELELIDPLDPFAEGVTYSVRPPNKSWREIKNLSGGEKTLSSLALVFALHFYKPTPLYIMDEIDAALDFRNVSIVANYIKERTKNAQFIIISLRYHMFEVCDRLIGIYKTEDCTQSVAVTNALPSPKPVESV